MNNNPEQNVEPSTTIAAPPSALPVHAKPSQAQVIGVVVAILLVLATLFYFGVAPRMERSKALTVAYDETAGAARVVQVIPSKPASDVESAVLPGNISAIQNVSINSRVDGYLKERNVDIGDHVKAGQVLAVIDTPDLDQQVLQAEADLSQALASLETSKVDLKEAQANLAKAKAEVAKENAFLEYASVTAQRWKTLCEHGSVSVQSRDEKVERFKSAQADVSAAVAQQRASDENVNAARSKIVVSQATVKAKKAAVGRFLAQQKFQKVLSPFNGIITARYVDPGALIQAGNMTNKQELYQMAKTNPLRIYIQVPQRISRYLHTGMTAQVSVPEFPERTFNGKITNIAGALDATSRTMQTEVRIDNTDNSLKPGMYSEVNVSTTRAAAWIDVPGNAIVVRPEGTFVVIVKDDKAHYVPISVGRDFGSSVEVRSGLTGNEQVIVNPDDDLKEGEAVKPEPLPAST